ncbi:hypothetical protein [Prescottella equi]|uniref:hypothetical protein n=1 Tax=Rhodococcus hoagii TaxID=43767 RepID=UPI0007CD6609|nr:hypothetical protein [Prescottella equi]
MQIDVDRYRIIAKSAVAEGKYRSAPDTVVKALATLIGDAVATAAVGDVRVVQGETEWRIACLTEDGLLAYVSASCAISEWDSHQYDPEVLPTVAGWIASVSSVVDREVLGISDARGQGRMVGWHAATRTNFAGGRSLTLPLFGEVPVDDEGAADKFRVALDQAIAAAAVPSRALA